jgi:hypothetical protein
MTLKEVALQYKAELVTRISLLDDEMQMIKPLDCVNLKEYDSIMQDYKNLILNWTTTLEQVEKCIKENEK